MKRIISAPTSKFLERYATATSTAQDSRRHADIRAYSAYGKAPITCCVCELHDRYPGVFIAPRLVFGLICAALILHLRPEAPGS